MWWNGVFGRGENPVAALNYLRWQAPYTITSSAITVWSFPNSQSGEERMTMCLENTSI